MLDIKYLWNQRLFFRSLFRRVIEKIQKFSSYFFFSFFLCTRGKIKNLLFHLYCERTHVHRVEIESFILNYEISCVNKPFTKIVFCVSRFFVLIKRAKINFIPYCNFCEFFFLLHFFHDSNDVEKKRASLRIINICIKILHESTLCIIWISFFFLFQWKFSTMIYTSRFFRFFFFYKRMLLKKSNMKQIDRFFCASCFSMYVFSLVFFPSSLFRVSLFFTDIGKPGTRWLHYYYIY